MKATFNDGQLAVQLTAAELLNHSVARHDIIGQLADDLELTLSVNPNGELILIASDRKTAQIYARHSLSTLLEQSHEAGLFTGSALPARTDAEAVTAVTGSLQTAALLYETGRLQTVDDVIFDEPLQRPPEVDAVVEQSVQENG